MLALLLLLSVCSQLQTYNRYSKRRYFYRALIICNSALHLSGLATRNDEGNAYIFLFKIILQWLAKLLMEERLF